MTYEGKILILLGRISCLRTRIQENLFPYLRGCRDDPYYTMDRKDLVTVFELLEIE
jgi:hypothetical protein